MTQTDEIKQGILSCLNNGMTDKREIFKHVSDTLGVPRPSVRRVAGALRRELTDEMRVLGRRLLAAEIRELERRRDEATLVLECLS